MLMCCVYAFSLHRESLDMILGDECLISEVVLSQQCRINILQNDEGNSKGSSR
jgi:hypothetical protein